MKLLKVGLLAMGILLMSSCAPSGHTQAEQIKYTYNLSTSDLDPFQVRLQENISNYVSSCIVKKYKQAGIKEFNPMQLRDMFENGCFEEFKTTFLANHKRPKEEMTTIAKKIGIVALSQSDIESLLKGGAFGVTNEKK